MTKIKAGNISKGIYIEYKHQPYEVIKTSFTSKARGGAFMRVGLRSVKTGETQNTTYKSTEKVKQLEIESQKLQYLYQEADSLVFMDPQTYQQVKIPAELLGEQVNLLTPELKVYIIFYQGKAIGVSLPPKVTLKVTESHPAVAGNTQGQAQKEVGLETGLKIKAPIFIKEGDELVIDSETKEYLSRA